MLHFLQGCAHVAHHRLALSFGFSTRGRKSSQHPPPPSLHIHRNVPRKGVDCQRFQRWDFLCGLVAQFPRRSPPSGPEPSTFGPSSFSVLRLSPISIVGHPPRLLRLHGRNAAPRSTVCMPLAHFLLRLSRQSSASVSSYSTRCFVQGSPLAGSLGPYILRDVVFAFPDA